MKNVLAVWIISITMAASACAAPRDAQMVRLSSRLAPDVTDSGDLAATVSGSYLAGRHAAMNNDTAAAARFFLGALAARPNDPVLRRRAFLTEMLAGRIDAAAALAADIPAGDPAGATARLVLAVQDIKARRFTRAKKELQRNSDSVLDAALNPMLLAWATYGARQPEKAASALAEPGGNAAFGPLLSYHAALIHDLAGNDQAAEAAYKAAKAELGSSARVILAYGRFLRRTGQQDRARALYDEFLKQAPDHPVIAAELRDVGAQSAPKRLISSPAQGAAEALYDLGSLLDRSLGGEALLYLRLALYLDPSFDMAHLLAGGLLEKGKQWDAAAAQYDAIATKSPLYETAQIQKAMALDSQDRTDQAIAVLDALIAKRPHSQDAVIARADILRMRERFALAAKGYDQAIQMIGKPTERHWGLYYARGVSLERAHRWREAERDLLLALQLNPDEPLVLNYLGYSWIEQGEHLARAQAMIEKAASQRPTDGYIVDSLGWVLFRLGRYSEAVPQLERAVELKPEDPLINSHLGDAYWQVGRRLEARFQWQHALSLNPAKDVAAELKQKIDTGLSTAMDGSEHIRNRAELQHHVVDP